MNLLRRVVKSVVLAPVNIVKGVADALDEAVNGEKKK